MSPSADDKSVVDRILDAGFYAPLGFLISGDQVCDEVVVAGRKQVAFARSLGRAALAGFNRGPKAPDSQNADTQNADTQNADTQNADAPSAEVAGYDAMTARDIVVVLKTATLEETRWIKARETAGKGRVSILRAADKRLD